ncbi:MAG: hypothetical protein AMXMBFR84_03430 [Candidatus Hydrogenedentota bacterium]
MLQAVKGQLTPHPIEIVAVDSGSTDGTLDILKEHNVRVIPIAPEDFDFGKTRDLVFEQTRGSFIVSLSQDAIPATQNWLENLLKPFDDPSVAVTCGRSVPDPDRAFDPFPWEANGYFYFTREMKKFRAKYGRGLSNANAAYRRSVWEELRFGEQPIGEDFRFQEKLHDSRHILAFVDDAPVLHHHDYTLRTLYKRCRNEGYGLRLLGFPYTLTDYLRDCLNPRKDLVWLRSLLKGRLRSPAAIVFPYARPSWVYMGSRFARGYLK